MPKQKPLLSSTSKPSNPIHRNTPFQEAHALEYGLEVSHRHPITRKILGVRCNFCAFFGHELLEGQERYRKQTKNIKNWTTFRSEYYRAHHDGQHSTRWKEYQGLNKEGKEKYFAEQVEMKDTILHHFQLDEARHIYRIDAAIVEIVIGISSSF
jgi:hypothetical protein